MTTQTDSYRIEIDLRADEISASSEALTKAAQAAKRLERSFRDVEQTVAGIRKIRQALDRLFASMEGRAELVSATTRAIQRLARVTASVDATMRRAAAKIDGAAESARKLETAAEGAASGVRQAGDEADRAGATLGGLTVGAVSAVGANQALELAKKAVAVAAMAMRTAIAAAREALIAWSESTAEGAAAAQAYSTAIDAFRGSLGQAVGETQFARDATDALERALASAEPAGRAAAEAIDLVYVAMREIAAIYGTVVLGLDSTEDAMDAARGTAVDLADALQTIADNVRWANETLGPWLRALYEVTSAINPLTAAYRGWVSALEAGNAAIGAVTGLFADEAEPALRDTTTAAGRFAQALDDVASGATITVHRANDLRATLDRVGASVMRFVTEGGVAPMVFDAMDVSTQRVTRSVDAAVVSVDKAALSFNQYKLALQAATEAEAEFRRTKGQTPEELGAVFAAADQARKDLEAEIASEIARGEALAAIEADRQRAAEEAARAHAERMRQVYTSAAISVADPLMQIYGAGIEAAIDSSADRIGVAARRIIGQQLVALGSSAVRASAVIAFGDPAAGFVPNPARSAALVGAGLAAIAAGTALGASANRSGGRGGTSPAPRPEPRQSVQQSQNITINMGGVNTDPRATARAIRETLAAASRQGAA